MSSTPPDRPQPTGISDSWVDLTSSASGPHSPLRVTPIPFGGEGDYLRMLQEAQRESTRSSTKVSPISSALMSLSSTTRNTPSASPKSPPNSPNPELVSFAEEFAGVYINRDPGNHHSANAAAAGVDGNNVTASDLIWDWSSKPNLPSKDWKSPTTSLISRKSSGSKWSVKSGDRLVVDSIKEDDDGDEGSGSSSSSSSKSGPFGGRFFGKGVLYTIIITNLVSLLIGAGVGIWLSKRGSSSSGSGAAGDAIVEIGI